MTSQRTSAPDHRAYSVAAIAFGIVAATMMGPTVARSEGSASSVAVPFVGCAKDGQVGPAPPPRGGPKMLNIQPAAARRLAYYSADRNGGGVLAPRGWYCFESYGSAGSTLYVAPAPVHFDNNEAALAGPMIQASQVSGGTSGRFTVAEMIARVFPTHRAFVRAVIAEGLVPASNFPFGPFATDHLTRVGDNVVEYRTPAKVEGLGTSASMLKRSGQPISGVAVLAGEDTDLAFLAVRLPLAITDLEPAIIQQFERANATEGTGSQDANSKGRSPLAAAQGFYSALSTGNGALAATWVIPAKRQAGPLSAMELTRFFSAMRQPLRLKSATEETNGAVLVHYGYVFSKSKSCDGVAEVHTAPSDGGYMIIGIHALGAC